MNRELEIMPAMTADVLISWFQVSLEISVKKTCSFFFSFFDLVWINCFLFSFSCCCHQLSRGNCQSAFHGSWRLKYPLQRKTEIDEILQGFSHASGVVCRLVHYFGSGWIVSTTTWWIDTKVYTYIHSPQMICPIDIGETLTFPLVPPWGFVWNVSTAIRFDTEIPPRDEF